ncbi:MAG: hypothetical protein K2L11_08170 [Muribaculaceae bacterium]|nr:hypothetical protein [Muribaculaceae bacterium]
MRISNSHGYIAAIFLAMAASLAVSSAEARKIRTKHSIPKEAKKPISSDGTEQSDFKIVSLSSDSIAFCDSILPMIRFYGFDKTVTSSIESFFISNGLQDTLTGLEVEISYSDMKGRQLHKRSVHIDCDIPSGETKRIDIKSWDTQKSFYFHKSVKPKRQATPFNVTLRPLSVTCKS